MISRRNQFALLSARPLLRAVAALLLVAASLPAFADNGVKNLEATPEYKLKAALLFKLTKFVSWPEMSSFSNEFNICVLGDNVFGEELEPLKERAVNQKSIDIEYYNQSDDIDSHCDLLFIEKSKEPFLSSIIRKFSQPGVLPISDIPGFAEQGGVVELTLVNNKVGFKINLDSAKSAELTFAAPLLQLATIIESSAGESSGD